MNITIRDTLSTDIKDLPGEIWEFIPGYGFRYQISNFSRVKSVIKLQHKIVKKTLSDGKFKVVLYPKKGFTFTKNENCARLCATVFDRPPGEKEVIKRKDGNPLNDIAYNLMWTSRKESINTAPGRSRYSQQGQTNGMAKLNMSKAERIRELSEAGRTYKWISETYSVSIPCIQKIVHGITWRQSNQVKAN